MYKKRDKDLYEQLPRKSVEATNLWKPQNMSKPKSKPIMEEKHWRGVNIQQMGVDGDKHIVNVFSLMNSQGRNLRYHTPTTTPKITHLKY